MGTFLTTEEVADLCRTSPSTVRFWAHQKSGPPSLRVGRRRLYDKADVTAWLEAAKVAS
jgi:excisionase family DNA binding protein